MGGGGKKPSVEEPPELEELPEEERGATSKSIRDREARELRARRGHAGTILSDPLGIEGITKLGRSFNV
jgi:hypothetical protein